MFLFLLEIALFREDGPLVWVEQIRWDDPDGVERNSRSISPESWHSEGFEKNGNEAIALNSVEREERSEGKDRNDL